NNRWWNGQTVFGIPVFKRVGKWLALSKIYQDISVQNELWLSGRCRHKLSASPFQTIRRASTQTTDCPPCAFSPLSHCHSFCPGIDSSSPLWELAFVEWPFLSFSWAAYYLKCSRFGKLFSQIHLHCLKANLLPL